MTTTPATASPIRASYRINPPNNNYMKKTIRIAVIIPIMALSISLNLATIIGTYRGLTAPGPVTAPVHVRGCATEDSCAADYRNGEWIIIPQVP